MQLSDAINPVEAITITLAKCTSFQTVVIAVRYYESYTFRNCKTFLKNHQDTVVKCQRSYKTCANF